MGYMFEVKILSMLFIASASAGGILMAFLFDRLSEGFLLFKANSAGIMFGLSLIHLLPDACANLREYPEAVPYSLFCLGVVIVIAMEQGTYFLLARSHTATGRKSDEEERVLLERSETYGSNSRSGDSEISGAKINRITSAGVCHHTLPMKDEQSKEEVNVFTTLVKSKSLKDIIIAYIMEISIAVHSVILGLDMGVMGDDELQTYVILMIALCVHQFIEGMGLGANIVEVQASLGSTKVAFFIMIFCVTMPLGIILGMLFMRSNDIDTPKGILNSLAGGSLLYIALVEMSANYFNEPILIDKPALRINMVLSFSLGVLAMAILGLYT